MEIKRVLSASVFLLLMILIPVTQAGCWSRIETDNLAIVTAIALDKTSDDKIQIAVEIVRPSAIASGGAAGEGGKGEASSGGGGDAGSEATLHIKATGETTYDAWRNLQLQMGRMVFFAHTQQIIAGEKLAREGIGPYLDFAEHRFRLRRNIGLSVAAGEAREVLGATPLLEPFVGLALNRFNANYTRQSKSTPTNLASFYGSLLNKHTEPVASRISLVREPETGQSHIEFVGAGVFKEDRLIGWLNGTETRGLNRILNDMGRGTIAVSCPNSKSEKKLSILTTQSITQVKSIIRDDTPIIQIEVSEEGEIADIECDVNVTQDFMAKLNIAYAEGIREEVEATLHAAQQIYGVDILGFGETVRRYQNGFWRKNKQLQENWETIFPELPVEITVEAKVLRVGLTLHPH